MLRLHSYTSPSDETPATEAILTRGPPVIAGFDPTNLLQPMQLPNRNATSHAIIGFGEPGLLHIRMPPASGYRSGFWLEEWLRNFRQTLHCMCCYMLDGVKFKRLFEMPVTVKDVRATFRLTRACARQELQESSIR